MNRGKNMDKEAFTPEIHKTRLNEVTLNNSLTAHERGLHSSFLNDYLLSESVQVLNVPEFPMLRIVCAVCHACEINKTLPSPGGITETKNSTIIQRNQAQLAKPMLNNTDKILSSRLKI